MSRTTRSTMLAAMAAALLAGMAPGARAADLEVVEVRIHARHVGTDADIGWVNPGDTLVLPPRTEVKLWLEARPRGRGPRYPGARYDVTEGVAVVGRGDRVVVRTNGRDREVVGIKSSNPPQGAVVLQTFGHQGESVVRYTILDTIQGLAVPRDLRTSAFTVRVSDDAGIVGYDYDDDLRYGVDGSSAERLVAELYRGILLREPDREGLAGYARRVHEGGYGAVIETAVEIADSEESRLLAYRRGADEEDRLDALYRHLLGVGSGAIDRDQWRDDLDRLHDGDVARVVDEMVRSEAFRDRFGFETARRRFALPR